MNEDVARLFFAGDLAQLLTCEHASGRVGYPVDRPASIKDVVEAIGIPHTEIHSIKVNDQERDFSLPLVPGLEATFLPADMTSRYPVDVTEPSPLRQPLSDLRFLVDENVAGLVPLLRALGFDTAYNRHWDDDHIAHTATAEGRVVLTRDRALLKRSLIEHGRLIRSQVVDEQLVEVLTHFKTRGQNTPFSRCLRCNVVTEPVKKEDILHRLEPKTRKHYHTFRRCPSCDRIYWRGTHHEKLMARFRSLGIDLSLFTS